MPNRLQVPDRCNSSHWKVAHGHTSMVEPHNNQKNRDVPNHAPLFGPWERNALGQTDSAAKGTLQLKSERPAVPKLAFVSYLVGGPAI